MPVPSYFREWRNRYLESTAEHDRLGLARGIFLGDDSAVKTEVRERFRQCGLSHLLAASGFNCWIVSALFGIVASLSLASVSPFLPAVFFLHVRRIALPVSQFVGAWLFWSWTDQSPPISRSAIMITGKLVFDALGIPVPFHRVLLVQYLGSLVLMPALWRSASFQLTFGCLFGLILFPPLFERFKPTQLAPMAESVWDYFVTSLGAVLGTIPTTLLVFGEANFMSISTNWFAVPPVSFIVMPLGLVEMMLLAPGLPLADSRLIATIVDCCAWACSTTASWLDASLQIWLAVMPQLRLEF